MDQRPYQIHSICIWNPVQQIIYRLSNSVVKHGQLNLDMLFVKTAYLCTQVLILIALYLKSEKIPEYAEFEVYL